MSGELIEAVGEGQAYAESDRIDGVVIGLLVGIDAGGSPLVAFPGNTVNSGVSARSTIELRHDDIGRELALMFEGGDPVHPLVIGRIHRPEGPPPRSRSVAAECDGERLELRADQEIVLRCGRASITLTRAGKILLRGAYLLSRSSGVNRIKGGSVQIN